MQATASPEEDGDDNETNTSHALTSPQLIEQKRERVRSFGNLLAQSRPDAVARTAAGA